MFGQYPVDIGTEFNSTITIWTSFFQTGFFRSTDSPKFGYQILVNEFDYHLHINQIGTHHYELIINF